MDLSRHLVLVVDLGGDSLGHIHTYIYKTDKYIGEAACVEEV